jgi:hypothetical protein
MKNTYNKFIAIMVVLTALSPLRAFAAVNVYADDIQSNAAAVTSETPAVTNAAATTTHRNKKFSSDADHPPVRIDETGIHVGGSDPVDIEVPQFARHGSAALIGLVAVLVPLAPFVMVVAIIAIVFYFKHRRHKLAHETLRAMIEKGMPVTPELVAQLNSKHPASADSRAMDAKAARPRSGLLPGLILTGIGTALLISSPGHNKGGWIVLFIGIAFLIVWYVERKNQNNVQPPR